MTQTDYNVGSASDLDSAIRSIDAASAYDLAHNQTNYFTINFKTPQITETADLAAINLKSNDILVINGNGDTLDGNNGQYRGLFVYSGNVTINDLAILDATARGGNGYQGGGGGAGLGGGLFVANNVYNSTTNPNGDVTAVPGNVTLSNVYFANNAAIGGSSSSAHYAHNLGGGGGGMGGNGGYNSAIPGVSPEARVAAGSGGGGVGLGANGGGGGSSGGGGGYPGYGGNGGNGIVPDAAGGAGGQGTSNGPNDDGHGGASGGGGGGAGNAGGFNSDYKGGGGGVGAPASTALTGGFGGGGGGVEYHHAGRGGFGGGGGASVQKSGGAGGFGGGGGASSSSTGGPGAGGFGGGNGAAGAGGGGGGGLGAGGDIFVQQGASLYIDGSARVYAGTVGGGSSYNGGSGSGFGSGIFLQGNQAANFSPGSNAAVEVDGVIADQTGSGGTGSNAGAGHVNANGPGDVDLGAANTYTGGTTINGGTLSLEQNTSAGTGAITFAAQNVKLTFGGTSLANTLSNITAGDEIDLYQLAYQGGATATVSGSILTVTSGGSSQNFTLSNLQSNTAFTVSSLTSFFGTPGSAITAIQLPTIGNTSANQGVRDDSTIDPFAGVQIADSNSGAQDAVTITLKNAAGQASDANGLLYGAGLNKTGTGTYTLTSGSPGDVQAALQALVFTPTYSQVATGSTVTTGFTLSLNDGLTPTTVTNSTTSVVATGEPKPLAINGVTTTPITDRQTATPFSGVTLGDPNFNPNESVTIQVSYRAPTSDFAGGYRFNSSGDTDANGTFAPMAGLTETGPGTYTLTSGTPAAVQAALQALVFQPTAHQVTPGNSVKTYFDIVVQDGQANNYNPYTLVVATAAANPPAIGGTTTTDITDQGTANPFPGVSVSDANPGVSGLTATVSFDGADGSFTADLLAAAGFAGQNGTYSLVTVTDAATLSTDLQKLVFVPTEHQVTPGTSVTTAFMLAVNDGVGPTGTDSSTTIVATATETAPTIGGTPSSTITDAQTADPFSGVSVTDPDFDASETATITVTVGGNAGDADGSFAPMAGLTETAPGTYTLAAGTPSAVQSALQALVFVPTAHQVAPGASVTTGFTLALNDGIAPDVTDSTTSLVATATETAPTIGGTMTSTVTDAQTANPFSGVSITDPDFDASESVTITVTAGGTASDADGTFAPMAGLTETAPGIYTLAADTPSAVQAALQTLVFTPTAHQVAPGSSVTTGFTLAVDDGIAPAVIDSGTSVVATATETAPTIGGTTITTITDAQTANPFFGVSVTDPDFGASESVTITVTANGNASDADGTFAPMAGLTETAPGTYTLAAGTPAAVQSALQALVFTPTAHQVAPGSTVTTGFTLSVGDGIAPTVTDSSTSLVATASETAPVIGGTTSSAITDAQTANPFSGVSVTDPDLGASETVTITVEVNGNPSDADGIFTPMAGLTETAPGIYTLAQGTPSAVQAALQALVFTPTAHQAAPGSAVTTGFTLAVNDGLAPTVTDSTTSVVATATETAPTIGGTMSSAITDAQTANPFSGVSVTDPDFGASESVTITVTAGGTATDADGTFAPLAGLNETAPGTYTLAAGTPAAVQAALQALVFTPTAHQVAPGSSVTTGFTLAVNDGIAPAVADSGTSVVATATETAPTISGTTTSAITDAQTANPFSGVSVTDPDFGASESITITVTANGGASDADGTFAPMAGLTETAPGTYTLAAGTPSAVQSALQALVFTPTAHQVAPGSSVTTGFTLAVNDGLAPTVTDSGTSVVATATDTAPTIGGTTTSAITDAQTANPFSGVSVTDVDTGINGLTATVNFNGADGSFTAASLAAAGFTGQNGSYSLVTGTDATTLTSDLQKLVFVPAAHQVTPGASVTTAFTLALDDQHGGTTSDSSTGVVATATDTPPTIGGATTSAITDQQTANPFSGLSVTDVDTGITGLTATVRFDGADGSFTAASLAAAGFTGQNGSYSLVTGTDATTLTSDLQKLVFVPTAHQVTPGASVTTAFTLALDDQHGGTTSDSTTSVVATATDTAPAIGGTTTSSITDAQTANPFSAVSITDPDFGASETATITVTAGGNASDADGTFGPMTGLTETAPGTYSLQAGTPSAVQAALRSLVFRPTPHQVAPGSSVTTGFRLAVNDGTAPAVIDSTTRVVATATDTPPTISGTTTSAITDAQATNPFSGVTVSDVDTGITGMTATISFNGADGSFTAASLAAAGFTGQNGSYSLTTGTDATTLTSDLRQLVFVPTAYQVMPGASVTTAFTLALDDQHGGTTRDGTTSVVATAAPVLSPMPGHNSAGTTSLTVAFDPTVSFSSATRVTFTGTVADTIGAGGVELFEGSTDLGAATLNGDGTWSFTTNLARGFHAGFVAVATDPSGNSASAPSDFDLTTGVKSPIPGQPYTAVQDRYDAGGNFLGQTFFQRHGAVLFSSSFAVLPNGDLSYTYSGGTFFNDKPYSSFTDQYTAPGLPASLEILNNTDGSHTITAEEGGVALRSIGQDTMVGAGSGDRFVFSPGFGHDTITGFEARGPGHDTLVLPSADASRLAQILASAHTVNGDTTFHLNRQDSITLQGVTLAELKTHPNDFKFHA